MPLGQLIFHWIPYCAFLVKEKEETCSHHSSIVTYLIATLRTSISQYIGCFILHSFFTPGFLKLILSFISKYTSYFLNYFFYYLFFAYLLILVYHFVCPLFLLPFFTLRYYQVTRILKYLSTLPCYRHISAGLIQTY